MLHVGQKLWMVTPYRAINQEVAIIMVDNRWATIDYPSTQPYRIDVETLRIDGGNFNSPGYCWESREIYEREKSLETAWREMVHGMPLFGRPPHITLEDIAKIREIVSGPGEAKGSQ